MTDATRKEYQLSKKNIQMHQEKLIEVDMEQMGQQAAPSVPQFSKETMKAFEEADAINKGNAKSKKYNTPDELFEDLGI